MEILPSATNVLPSPSGSIASISLRESEEMVLWAIVLIDDIDVV